MKAYVSHNNAGKHTNLLCLLCQYICQTQAYSIKITVHVVNHPSYTYVHMYIKLVGKQASYLELLLLLSVISYLTLAIESLSKLDRQQTVQLIYNQGREHKNIQ